MCQISSHSVQGSLRTAESEVSTFRTRVSELRLLKDQRSLLSAESQYRDQLTERNTLLLTIYQYTDKILGVDKTPTGGQAETKPFTNFSVFHDNLITRLKALSQIQLDFDKRSRSPVETLTSSRAASRHMRKLKRLGGASLVQKRVSWKLSRRPMRIWLLNTREGVRITSKGCRGACQEGTSR